MHLKQLRDARVLVDHRATRRLHTTKNKKHEKNGENEKKSVLVDHRATSSLRVAP